jgi:recombinational DNA repair protein (RecF pathway)
MRHLDSLMDKLTTAGFTINLNKCSFCKEEVKFLEHVLSRTELKADRRG